MRYVALIRGINLGSARRVAMAELRAALLELGYEDVRTVLNSGNAILTAPAADPSDLAAGIEEALVDCLGIAARVLVLSDAELEAVITQNPLSEIAANPSRLVVAFLLDPADRAKLAPLLEQDWQPEELALGQRVAYLWCPRGTVGSPLAQAVDRILGGAATNRTMGTVMRIQALLE